MEAIINIQQIIEIRIFDAEDFLENTKDMHCWRLTHKKGEIMRKGLFNRVKYVVEEDLYSNYIWHCSNIPKSEATKILKEYYEEYEVDYTEFIEEVLGVLMYKPRVCIKFADGSVKKLFKDTYQECLDYAHCLVGDCKDFKKIVYND